MKHLCFPASYARLSEEEQCETIGGGDLRSAWSTFTDNLHFGDFSMGSGLLTFSISFVPMLLFNVVKTGFNFVVQRHPHRIPGRGNDLQQAERPVRLSGRDPDGFPAVYRRDAQ